jgi:N-formylglutamate amidohydrolase
MEIACRSYMQETAPFTYDEVRATAVETVLREVLDTMLTWGEAHREAIV